MTVATPPTARRISRPRWLDIRVIGGVVLLIASIAIGARVIGAASRTSPVWAAAHDVAAGTVLTASDLTVADVNLGDFGGHYVDASAGIAGRVLNSPVRAGEFVPASSLGEVGDSRVLSIAVSPDHIAAGVTHGSVVDLYLVTGSAAVAGAPVTTELLRSDVTIQSVTAPASGGLSGAVASRYQVALLLTADAADTLVRQLPLGEPVLVLHTGGAPAAGGR